MMMETILAVLALLAAGQSERGWTSRYDPGVMEATAAYHGLDLDAYDGAVAAADCSRLGETWLIRKLDDGRRWLRVVVADCAGRDAYDAAGELWMHRQNVICELSYPLAERLNALDGGVQLEVIRP